MRAWLTGLIGAALLALVPSMASADSLTVTPQVEKDYQDYLAEIAHTGSGAFAVSVSGHTSYFVYCPSRASCGSVKEAMDKCRAHAAMECVLFAKGKSLEVEYKVAERQLTIEPGSPVTIGKLTGAQIKALIVGNSQKGKYENNVAWAEFFAPDGTITGKVGDDDYTARYKIDGDTICYDYDGTDNDWCATLGISGGKLHQFSPDGKLQGDLEDTVIVKGNALEGATEPVALN